MPLPFNLRDLEYLVLLDEEQHFRRAAERGFVSQPTLSGQLKKLEEQLGVVLVERTSEVRDGEIVVALVSGNETTLKRFYRESGARARLQPANSSMTPILVPLTDLQIQGRVLAVLRKYK